MPPLIDFPGGDRLRRTVRPRRHRAAGRGHRPADRPRLPGRPHRPHRGAEGGRVLRGGPRPGGAASRALRVHRRPPRRRGREGRQLPLPRAVRRRGRAPDHPQGRHPQRDRRELAPLPAPGRKAPVRAFRLCGGPSAGEERARSSPITCCSRPRKGSSSGTAWNTSGKGEISPSSPRSGPRGSRRSRRAARSPGARAPEPREPVTRT